MGKEGKLPWHCPEDLKHFAETTFDYPMIMGYRTFLSLPTRYLDNRDVIVFSRRKHPAIPNVIFVSSLSEFLDLQHEFGGMYVIGGAQIYTLFLQENLIEEFILTQMKEAYEGDTFFPLSLLEGWGNDKIKESDCFTIYRYFNPNRVHANKNL